MHSELLPTHRTGQPTMTDTHTDDTWPELAGLPTLLTLKEVSSVLRKSRRTLRTWEKNGHLRVIRPAGGHALVRRSELQRLLMGDVEQ